MNKAFDLVIRVRASYNENRMYKVARADLCLSSIIIAH